MSTYDDYSDGELVSLCLEDDRPASETLILRYRNLVYSIPMKHGFEPDDCGDVAHDVWVAFKANLHTLRDREKVYSWLMTTTTRKCIALASQKQKQQDSAQQTREEPFDPAGTAEDIMLWTEKQQGLRMTLEKWHDRCSLLLTMLYFEDRSYEEAANRLEVSREGIGALRARCLDRLRTMLSERGITNL
jgi:RNA polymerase sigma factor (sigma-70 family)